MNVPVITSRLLAGLPHGFLGRKGGASTGVLAGLNVGTGSDDDRAAIAENRRRAIDAVLPGAALATVHQVHSADAVLVDRPWPHDERPQADAMVTDRPGVLLGILTADCAPVLLADREAGVVGAAHAGWRGALAGVTDRVVVLMEARGARRDRLRAVVGPCIAQPSYEVDAAFRDRFRAQDRASERFFIDGPDGRPHFDLPGYVLARLVAAGVGEAEAIAADTYAEADHFFSYRRATHRGEADYGRQISLIALAP